MKTTKIKKLNGSFTHELYEFETRPYKGVDVSYKSLYYLDNEVDKYTGEILKNEVKYHTEEQVKLNLEAFKKAVSKIKT